MQYRLRFDLHHSSTGVHPVGSGYYGGE